MKNLKNLEELVDYLNFLTQAANLGLVEKRDNTKNISTKNWKFISEESINIEITETEKFNFITFVDDFRTLFPKGIMSGGYYVAGDKVSCKRKLKKFFQDYDYTPDIVLEATNRYVTTMAKQDFKYMKLSHYFISKDGISTLASECEAVKVLGDEYKKGNSKTL
tara:strand:+ start:5001 stop:5492 length:492 start_codon:yes stop_codon:yes gene_type:complete